MANIKLQRGNLSDIQNTSPKDGTLSIAKDNQQIFLDDNEGRIIVGEANYVKSVTYPAVVDSNGALSVNTATTANSGLMSSTDKTTLDSHTTNTKNPHAVTKAQVGLSNVDNTSDINKPISTATQTALNTKQDKITGTEGQVIGFNTAGEAVPQSTDSLRGPKGDNGKSAYELAKDAGYTGTEAEFNAALLTLKNAPFLPTSGGTLTGNLTGKYLTGTWLQTLSATDLNRSPKKIAVIENGWIYYRTPQEILVDLSAATADHTHSEYASSSHTHSTSDITGTLSTSQLPVIPISGGGTNATTVADALSNLGAAAANHTHSGYASSSHTHSGYASSSHSHNTYAPKASPVFTESISLGRKSGTTVGTSSVAVGNNVTASDAYSYAEGTNTIASSSGSHAEGSYTTASGGASHAEGGGAAASGSFSHAEGTNTIASGEAAHAEGAGAKAEGLYSHAEGNIAIASGDYSHAECIFATASGEGAHAEGYDTSASGQHSHAEGHCTHANSEYSHAEGAGSAASNCAAHTEGWYTAASNYAAHASGKYNKEMATGESETNTTGDVFVIGNGKPGARSNAFRVTYAGAVYGVGSFKTSGADYAEYFEWVDGNPDNEDRVSHFVTMKGNKIRIAQPNDYILGIVSGQPCIIGNADEDWLGRWLHDEHGRFILEYLEDEKTEVPTEEMSEDEIFNLYKDPDIRKEDDKFYRITSKVVNYETPSYRFKANPEYDSTQPYIERKDRAEWDAIGMVGVLSVYDDGTCVVDGLCKVANGGIATSADDCTLGTYGTYRVIERVSDNIIKVIFK